MNYYSRLYHQPDAPAEKAWEGVLPFPNLREACRKNGETRVGHVGGEKDLAEHSIEYLGAKPWKWRLPSTPGNPIPGNWILAARFLELAEQIEGRGRGHVTDPMLEDDLDE